MQSHFLFELCETNFCLHSTSTISADKSLKRKEGDEEEKEPEVPEKKAKTVATDEKEAEADVVVAKEAEVTPEEQPEVTA